jgi:hypothetical protein
MFQWNRLHLNWVRKLRSDGVLAADLQTYLDDFRTSGPTEFDCWKASQRVSSVLGSVGIQDTPRTGCVGRRSHAFQQ